MERDRITGEAEEEDVFDAIGEDGTARIVSRMRWEGRGRILTSQIMGISFGTTSDFKQETEITYL
jgi:hypothetical protein